MKRILPAALPAALAMALIAAVASGCAGAGAAQAGHTPSPPSAVTITPTPSLSPPAPPITVQPLPTAVKPLPPVSSKPKPKPKPTASTEPFNPQDPKNLATLQPKLRGALTAAMAAARADGITLVINSGWRSAAFQNTLWLAAIKQYGSPEKARLLVLPPNESDHVKGLAVDIGPWGGADWLQKNGSQFGLCPKYANEHWHFEYRTKPGGTCPPQLPHP